MPQQQIQLEQQVIDRGAVWAEAERRGDVEGLERLLASDFIGVGPRGFVLTREQWLGRYRSGDLHNASFTFDDVAVRVFGGAAVLIGRQTVEGSHQGHPISGRFRTSLLFIQQDDAWLLAGLQVSPLVEG